MKSYVYTQIKGHSFQRTHIRLRFTQEKEDSPSQTRYDEFYKERLKTKREYDTRMSRRDDHSCSKETNGKLYQDVRRWNECPQMSYILPLLPAPTLFFSNPSTLASLLNIPPPLLFPALTCFIDPLSTLASPSDFVQVPLTTTKACSGMLSLSLD